MIEMLEAWVMMDGNKQALPAIIEQLKENELKMIITEWKFHQVKRMLRAVGNEVIYLRRDRIWIWELWDIKIWERKYV
jgi:16S rRNA pseudouridine516 synthase